MNSEIDLGVQVALEPVGTSVAADGTGYLASVATVSVEGSQSQTFVRAIALGASFPADWEGRHGLPLETLMANVAGDDGTVRPNDDADGAADLSDDFRRAHSFIGVPGAGGVLVADVTDLSDGQLAALDPADPATFEQSGVDLLPYTVDDAGRVQVVTSGDDGRVLAGEKRSFYVAAPYAQSALDLEDPTADTPDPDTYKPVSAAFDVVATCVHKGSAAAYPQRFVRKDAFAKGADAPQPEPAAPEGEGQREGEEEGESGEDDDPDPDVDAPAPADEAPADGAILGYGDPDLAPAQLLNAETGAQFIAKNRSQASRLGGGIALYASVEKLPDTYLDPNLHIANGTRVEGATNTVIDRRTSERVEMSLQPNLNIPGSGGYLGRPSFYSVEDRREAAVIFRMDIPYLIFDAKGSKETLDEAEWQKAQESQPGKTKNEHQRLAYFPNSDALNRYDFSRDGKTWLSVEELTAEDGPVTTGLSGTWYLRYKSTSSEQSYQLRAGAQTLTGEVRFTGGAVPDNTGATILLGYQYQYYVNKDGEEVAAQQPTEVEPGRRRADGAQNVLRATFIQTNLKWDVSNRPLTTPVLWDRYNYAVYKVQVKNNSDTRDSEIDFINYVLMFDAATGSTSGIRLEDLLTWKRNGSGDFVENKNISASEVGAVYIGKPKQGGALVYDVSELTDDQINSIDMVDFSNVGDFGLTELPYATGGRPGQITVDIHEDDMPYGKHLYSHTDAANKSESDDFVPPEDESDVHTLLVAMPYTTNYGTGEGGYTRARLQTYATVNFGNRGYDKDGNSNDYQWMKNTQTTSNFAAPTFDVRLNKRARHLTSGALGAQQNAPLGEMVTYVIDGMRNNGNTPLFGDDPDVSWGAVLADGLPSGFQLTGLTLRVNASSQSQWVGEGDEAHTVADISDWFDTSQGAAMLEFEVTDSSGNTSWRAAPAAFAKIGGADDGSYAEYRIGSVEHAADGIAEMLEAQGVAAVPGRRHASIPAYTFTGHFRLKFNKQLPPQTDIAASLSVTGLMMERASNGANGWYDNQADITYGRRLFVAMNNAYVQPRETTAAAKATFVPVDPVPQTTAKVFSMYDGSGSADVTMSTEADRRNALVDTANAGYRFRFGDNSTSRMAPAVITVGPIPDRDLADPTSGKDPQFVANRIKLSGAFFGTDPVAKVSKVTLTYYATEGALDIVPRTMEVPLSRFSPEMGSDGVTPTGSYYLDMAPLGVGYLLSVDIELERFAANKPLASSGAMVEILGHPAGRGRHHREGLHVHRLRGQPEPVRLGLGHAAFHVRAHRPHGERLLRLRGCRRHHPPQPDGALPLGRHGRRGDLLPLRPDEQLALRHQRLRHGHGGKRAFPGRRRHLHGVARLPGPVCGHPRLRLRDGAGAGRVRQPGGGGRRAQDRDPLALPLWHRGLHRRVRPVQRHGHHHEGRGRRGAEQALRHRGRREGHGRGRRYREPGRRLHADHRRGHGQPDAEGGHRRPGQRRRFRRGHREGPGEDGARALREGERPHRVRREPGYLFVRPRRHPQQRGHRRARLCHHGGLRSRHDAAHGQAHGGQRQPAGGQGHHDRGHLRRVGHLDGHEVRPSPARPGHPRHGRRAERR